MSADKLIKETALYAFGEIIPKIISFILLPVYTHYLSPSDYGILSYTNSVVTFLFILSSLSLNSFLLRSYFEKNNETERKLLIGNVYLFIGFINLILLVSGFLVVPALIFKTGLQIPWDPYFKLALINNFLDVFSIIPLVVYRVKQKAKIYILLSVGRTILQFGLTFLLIVVLRKGVIGHYYGRLFSLIPFFIIYWSLMYKEAILRINLRQIKEGLRFAMPLLPGAISYLALSFSDRIILERYVAISQIGIYNIAYTLAFSINIVVQSGYKAIEPEIFKRYNSTGFTQFIGKVQSQFLFVVYVAAMTLTLYSQEVFKIMASKDFYEGYLLVPIIILGAIMTGQNVIFGGVLQAEKNTKAIGLASILGGFVSILFNLALIPRYGIYAASVSSALALLTMNLFLFFKMKLEQKEIGKELLSLLLFCLFTFGLFYLLKIQYSLINMLLKSGILILYTFVLSRLFKVNLKLAVKNLYNAKKGLN